MNRLFIDTETTGLPVTKGFNKYHNPEYTNYYDNSRLIEVAYIIYDNNMKIVKEVENVIKPNGFIIENSHIHGIKNDYAIEYGKDVGYVLDELLYDLSNVCTVIAHNINFDINIILSECYRLNRYNLIDKLLLIDKECTMEIGRNYMNSLKSPKLTILYESLFSKPVVQDHRALSDTRICSECYFKMLENK